MTNELEKTFFDTFGIRAYYKYLLIDKTSRCNNEKLFDKQNFIDFIKSGKDYLLLKVIKYHPQITDRILLELICILSGWKQYCISYYVIDAVNINTLKSDILRDCICMLHWYEFNKCSKDIKQKVQTLFKEEK